MPSSRRHPIDLCPVARMTSVPAIGQGPTPVPEHLIGGPFHNCLNGSRRNPSPRMPSALADLQADGWIRVRVSGVERARPAVWNSTDGHGGCPQQELVNVPEAMA